MKYVLKSETGEFYKSNLMNVIVEVKSNVEDAKHFDTEEEAQAVKDEEPSLLKNFEIVGV